jgi:hypothetical protein
LERLSAPGEIKAGRPGGLKGAAQEVLIVVVGILLAFGFDSWWTQREELERERYHLDLEDDYSKLLAGSDDVLTLLGRTDGPMATDIQASERF